VTQPDIDAIAGLIQASFPGVVVITASEDNGAPEVSWGDLFFFYDPEDVGAEARKFPFATIVTHDYGDFDNRSRLDREGVFRLNIDVGPETFDELFPAGTAVDDYAQLDVVIPHPVYAEYHWISVLSPSPATIESVKPHLEKAHERHSRRYPKATAKKRRTAGGGS